MYLIEDEDHTLVPDGKGRTTFNSLKVVYRPDGGQTNNAKVDEPLFDEGGQTLFIREVVEQPKPDNKFYYSSYNIDGSWTSTAKNLDDVTETILGEDVTTVGLKTQWIARIKKTANSLLAPTDWQVIAEAERDRAIDSDVATYRAAVISKCAAIETAVTNAADFDAFKALFDAPVDSDGKPTGNAPMHDWPE
jgi:hypothetical protein